MIVQRYIELWQRNIFPTLNFSEIAINSQPHPLALTDIHLIFLSVGFFLNWNVALPPWTQNAHSHHNQQQPTPQPNSVDTHTHTYILTHTVAHPAGPPLHQEIETNPQSSVMLPASTAAAAAAVVLLSVGGVLARLPIGDGQVDMKDPISRELRGKDAFLFQEKM